MGSESITFRRRLLLLALGVLAMALLALSTGPARAAAEKEPDSGRDEGVRTLEAIQIEGEIAIPQVLFITSRDHPRHRDGLRERYRETVLLVGREARFPHRLEPVSPHPKPQK